MRKFITLLFFYFFSLSNFDEASAEVLKVGTVAEHAPFEYVSPVGIIDQYDGLDIALIKALGADLGLELQVEALQFGSLLVALKTGKIDVAISGMTITKERSRAVNFSIPYYTDKQVMLVPKNSSISKASDMKGKRILVAYGSTGEVCVKKLGLPYEALSSQPEGIIELKNGKCDVIVIGDAVARRFCSGVKEIKVVEDDNAFGVENFGIAVNKNNIQLLEKINASITKLKQSGVLDDLLKKYIQ